MMYVVFLQKKGLSVTMALLVLVTVGLFFSVDSAFANGLDLTPNKDVLKEEASSISGNLWDIAKELAAYASFILLLIAIVVRAFAGQDNNKIQSAKSFATWAVVLYGAIQLLDKIASLIMGIFTK